MIQVVLRGGLGNQMFEYSLGLALAKKYKTDLVLDTTYLNDRFPRKNMTYRNYDLDVWSIEPKFTALSKISTAFQVPGLWLGLDLGFIKMRDMFGMRKLVKEKNGLQFDPTILEGGPDACLWGFWQSPRYFAEAENEIREAFRFREPLPKDAALMADSIRGTNSISLSVRRGDYLRAGNAKIYGETNMEYYDAAVSYVAARVPSPHFFIFSDDIAWCREHIKPPFPTTYVEDSLRGPKWRWTLELSSLCKHHIIANSTFWWWGAWLNANPEKIVIAPKRWSVAQDAAGPSDIVPAGWVQM